jgi:hypothetical protein
MSGARYSPAMPGGLWPVEIARDFDVLIQEVAGVRERTRPGELRESARAGELLACWTRKEAVAGTVGSGVGYSMPNIDWAYEPANGTFTFQCCDAPARRCRNWRLRTVNGVSEGFVLSIAMRGDQLPFRPTASPLPSSYCVRGVFVAARSAADQSEGKCKFPPLRRALMSKSSTAADGRSRNRGRSSPTSRPVFTAGHPPRTAAES